jgi:hypothetical protein
MEIPPKIGLLWQSAANNQVLAEKSDILDLKTVESAEWQVIQYTMTTRTFPPYHQYWENEAVKKGMLLLALAGSHSFQKRYGKSVKA